MGYQSVSDYQNQPVLEQIFTNPLSMNFKRWARLINSLIFISCISLALETIDEYSNTYTQLFWNIELTSVFFFTLDYLGNLYFAKNRIKYFFSFWGLVDLISILPTLLLILNANAVKGAKVFRVLRMLRVLRVLKMAKTAVLEMTGAVKSANPLKTNLRIYFIALFAVTMISSSLMYFVEGDLYSTDNMTAGQAALDADHKIHPLPPGSPPEASIYAPLDTISGNTVPADKHFFTSIPATMWWCIVTLTTTGYGDMFPVTFGGRIIAACTMLLGLVLFGLLMNIVGKSLMVFLFGESMTDDKGTTKEHAISMLISLKLIESHQGTHLLDLPEEELKAKLRQL